MIEYQDKVEKIQKPRGWVYEAIIGYRPVYASKNLIDSLLKGDNPDSVFHHVPVVKKLLSHLREHPELCMILLLTLYFDPILMKKIVAKKFLLGM